jgi:hypothetical protein
VQIVQVLVDVGVDRGDLAQRSLVQLLQDRELDTRFAIDGLQGVDERSHDRVGGQRIGIGLEVRATQQVPHPAIELEQLVLTLVLDDAREVAGDYRLVHRRRIHQRELRGIDARKIRLRDFAAGDPVIDTGPHTPFEFGEERGTFVPDRIARGEEELLLVPNVGVARCSIRRSATPSSMPVKSSTSPWTAMSPQSPRNFANSRGTSRVAVVSVMGAFTLLTPKSLELHCGGSSGRMPATRLAIPGWSNPRNVWTKPS